MGQCRNTPPGRLDAKDWVDDTPPVDCSTSHTLETVEVVQPAQKLTLTLVKQLAPSCDQSDVGYLGISFPAVRTLTEAVVSWPSRAQRAAGQNWLRCDIGVTATTGCCRHLAPQTGSLRGDVGSDRVRFDMCIDQLPDPTREQPLTSCTRPHRAEVLPTELQIEVTHYPSSAALNTRGRAECATLASHRSDHENLIVTPDWEPRDHWSGGTLYGRCWVHRR